MASDITFILAQIFGGISGVMYILSGVQKTHKRIIGLQCIDGIAVLISNLLLKGFAGAIINTISLTRNFISYKNKLSRSMSLVVIAVQVIATVVFVDLTQLINWMPMIASTSYTFGIQYGSCKTTKLYMIYNLIMWIIYDLGIKSYLLSALNLIALVSVIVSMVVGVEDNKIESV